MVICTGDFFLTNLVVVAEQDLKSTFELKLSFTLYECMVHIWCLWPLLVYPLWRTSSSVENSRNRPLPSRILSCPQARVGLLISIHLTIMSALLLWPTCCRVAIYNQPTIEIDMVSWIIAHGFWRGAIRMVDFGVQCVWWNNMSSVAERKNQRVYKIGYFYFVQFSYTWHHCIRAAWAGRLYFDHPQTLTSLLSCCGRCSGDSCQRYPASSTSGQSVG